MPVRNIYLIGLILIAVGGSAVYLQTTGKYGLTVVIVTLLLFVLGAMYATLSNKFFAQKTSNPIFLFLAIISFCFFFLVYFITRSVGSASLLTAAVYTSCLLLPSVILRNWYLFKFALQPAVISPWLLPVPYVKSSAISLHLNSIPFTIKVASAPGSEAQEFSVTAPGIKTLGMVFSELIHEEKGNQQSIDFSDITDNPYGWIFYVRELGGLSNRQLDANLSLLDNRLKTNAVVTVQRQ